MTRSRLFLALALCVVAGVAFAQTRIPAGNVVIQSQPYSPKTLEQALTAGDIGSSAAVPTIKAASCTSQTGVANQLCLQTVGPPANTIWACITAPCPANAWVAYGSAGAGAAHASSHHFPAGTDQVDHDLLKNFVSAEHVPTLIGTFASRPAFGTTPRFFWASDTSKLYYDTGSAWNELVPTETDPALPAHSGDSNIHHDKQHALNSGADHTGTLDDSQIPAAIARDSELHTRLHAIGDTNDHSASTLALLNALVSDATLDDASSARTPTTHAPSHQTGGGDVVQVAWTEILDSLGCGSSQGVRRDTGDSAWECFTPATATGEVNLGSSLGAGEGTVFKDKTGVTLNFRSLKQGTGVTITQDANEITITATVPAAAEALQRTGQANPYISHDGIGTIGLDADEDGTDEILVTDTNIDIAAHPTSGQTIGIKEPGGASGGSTFGFKMPDSDILTGDLIFTITSGGTCEGEACIPEEAIEQGDGSGLNAGELGGLPVAAFCQGGGGGGTPFANCPDFEDEGHIHTFNDFDNTGQDAADATHLYPAHVEGSPSPDFVDMLTGAELRTAIGAGTSSFSPNADPGVDHSGFDTAVSANADVAANTAARHTAVTTSTITGDVEAIGTSGADGTAPVASSGSLVMTDVATEAELTTHKSSADHDGRYFTETELTAEDGAGPRTASSGGRVDWTQIENMPAGFQDGTDADTDTDTHANFTADDTNTITDPAGVTVTGGANNYTKASGTTLTVGKRFDFVDHFGAVGDGATDNTTAWANALAAVDVASCPVLHIPEGTFNIGTGRSIYNPTNCIHIEGEGMGVSIVDFQGDTDQVFVPGAGSPDFSATGVKWMNNNQAFVRLTNATNGWGNVSVTRNHFDDWTAAGLSWCILRSDSGDDTGFSRVDFSGNLVTGSNCPLDVTSSTTATYGLVTADGNEIDGNRGAKSISVGYQDVANQGPVKITRNTWTNCNPQGTADLALIRTKSVKSAIVNGNHMEGCSNPGGNFDGLYHAQGNSGTELIVAHGNTGQDPGSGSATCEAGLILIKGTTRRYSIIGNVADAQNATVCAAVKVYEAGGIISSNVFTGFDRGIYMVADDDSRATRITNNIIRGTTGDAGIDASMTDFTVIDNNTIDVMTKATGAVYGINASCTDTTGTCVGVEITNNSVSGLSSTGDESAIRFGLSGSGNVSFTAPRIAGNRFRDVEYFLYSNTGTSDLIDPIIEWNTGDLASLTALLHPNIRARISGTPQCYLPDISTGRYYLDNGAAACDGIHDSDEVYLASTLTELGGVTDTLEPTGGDVSGSFSGGFSVNSVQAGAVTPAGLDTTGGNAATDGPPARHFPRKVASSDAFDFETLSERLETLGLAASGGGRVCAGGSSIAGFDSSNGLICELDNDGSAAISAGRTWVIPSGTDSDTAGTVSDPCASLGQAIANTETGASGSQAFIELSSGEFQEPKRCVNHFPTICTVDANCSGFASTPYAPAECRSQIRFGRQCSHGKTDGSMCRGTCQFHSGLWCLHPNDCPKVGKCTGDGVTLCGVDADCAGPGGTCANFVVDTCSNTEFAGDGICLEDEFCATDGTTACSVASDCTATESGSCDVNTLTCIGNPEISCDNASSPDDTLCRACVGNGIVEGGETADAGNGVDELSVSCKTRSYITVRGVQFRSTQIEGLVNHIDKCAIDVSNTANAAFLDLLLRADDQGVAPLPSKGLLCSERMGTGINAFWTSLTSTIDSEFVDRNNPIHISGEGNLTWTLESIQPFNSLGVNGLTDSALLYMETARGNVSPTTGLTINGDPRFTNSVGCGAGICDSNNDGVPDASGVACNEDADCSGGGDCVQAYCASGDFGSFGGILQGGAEVAAVTNAPGHCNLSTEVACWNATDCPATESCTKDPGNGAFFYNMFDPELTIGGKDATEGADSDVHKYSGESYPTGHSYVRTWCSGGQSGCGVKAFLNSVDFRPAVPGPPDDPFLQDNDSQVVLQAGVSVGGLSVLTPQASDPTDGIEGMFWYSSASDTIKVQRSADIVSMLTTGALVGDLSDVIPGDIGDIPQWGSGGSLLGTSTFGGLLSGENVGTLANVTPGDNGDIPQWGASGALAGTSTLPVLTESLVAATNLSNVDDTTTAPVTGDRRRWDGTNWVPAPQSEYECVWIQDASAYAAASDSRLFLRFAPFTLLADPAYDVFKPATSICRLGSAGSVEFDLVARNLVSGALGTDVTSSTCTCTASGNAGGNCAGMLNGSTVPDNVALEIDMIGSPSAVPIEICVGGTMQ